MVNEYRDRTDILKPHVGKVIAFRGVVIKTHDFTRLRHQTVVASVYTPFGQIEHLSLELDAHQRQNLMLYAPVSFHGEVNRYCHDVRQPDGSKISRVTYGVTHIRKFHPINQLRETELSHFQEAFCRIYRQPFSKVLALPNDGSRERLLCEAKQRYIEAHQRGEDNGKG